MWSPSWKQKLIGISQKGRKFTTLAWRNSSVAIHVESHTHLGWAWPVISDLCTRESVILVKHVEQHLLKSHHCWNISETIMVKNPKRFTSVNCVKKYLALEKNWKFMWKRCTARQGNGGIVTNVISRQRSRSHYCKACGQKDLLRIRIWIHITKEYI